VPNEIGMESVLWWVAIWLPIVIGASTAIVLGLLAARKGPDA
jgi:hypothetical protein